MGKNEVKFGALLSYLLIFANAVYGMVISPFILRTIGVGEMGVYETIGALASSIAVLEFGIGSTMQRYIANMVARKQKKEIENFSAMGLIQTGILAIAISVVGFFLYFALDPAYGNSFTAAELSRAKEIYVLFILQIILHMVENFFFGVLAGYNRFTFSNSLKLVALILRIVLCCVFLPIFPNAITLVAATLIMEIVLISAELFYLKAKLRHKSKLHFWDRAIFKESFVYTLLMFAQTIIVQFNGHVDSWVIGAYLGTASVAIYSFAIKIYNMYQQCAMSISGVLLPTVTNRLLENADPRAMEDLVIKYGRMQWSFLSALLMGLICLGEEFFSVWLSKSFGAATRDCWILCLILVIPMTLPLVTNVCLTILRAKNLMRFRTFSLGYSLIANAAMTLVGTYFWGYWAAAIGTSLSTLIGSVISMNIYYQRKLGMNMFRVYKGILSRITLCPLIASVPCFVLNYLWGGTWLAFITKVICFLIIFLPLLWFFGFSKEERRVFIRRRTKK